MAKLVRRPVWLDQLSVDKFRDGFGLGLRTPKRFRLNRVGLDKAKPAKPKQNRCRSLIALALKSSE